MHKSMFVVAASFAAALTFAAPARATNFPVSGTITVNGNGSNLPSGGAFGNSTYDLATGALSSGKFTFPQSSVSTSSGTVVYQLSQTDTSVAQVGSDGVAAFSTATLKLKVISVGGFPIGNCEFTPISVDLTGTASSTGLDVEDRSFDIPPVASSACSGQGNTINNYLAGSSNSMDVHLDGDFTPPADADDKIFINGFDP